MIYLVDRGGLEALALVALVVGVVIGAVAAMAWCRCLSRRVPIIVPVLLLLLAGTASAQPPTTVDVLSGQLILRGLPQGGGGGGSIPDPLRLGNNLLRGATSTNAPQFVVTGEQDTTGAHANSADQLFNGQWQPRMMIDLSNPNTNGKIGLFINTKLRTALPGQRLVDGIYIDQYTPPDNGGAVSGIHVVNQGGGDAASFFHLSQARPVGYPDVGVFAGTALEVGFDHGSGLYLTACDNAPPLCTGTGGTPNPGPSILLLMGSTDNNSRGLQIQPYVGGPNVPPNPWQRAIWVTDTTGSDMFKVMLATGDTTIKGQLQVGGSIKTGDLVFKNGWRLTETPEGIVLLRPDGSIAQSFR